MHIKKVMKVHLSNINTLYCDTEDWSNDAENSALLQSACLQDYIIWIISKM